jgi:outer membrane protein OmpA-like peptidoglycan-associated protein
MRLKTFLAGTALMALPALAQAQALDGATSGATSGFYFGLGAGFNQVMNTDADASGASGAALSGAGFGTSGTYEFLPGGAVVLSLGYGYGNGLRAELEANLRVNSVDEVRGFNGSGVNSGTGTQVTYGLMANALYDFTGLGLPGGVIPYAGAGLGAVITEYNHAGGMNGATGTRVDGRGTELQPAAQAILGAAMPVPEFPGLSLTAEYRFLGTLSNEVRGTARINGSAPATGKIEADNLNHSLLIGLRYAFGAQPAPPPPVAEPAPAAPPAVARTYLVFFDFDRADLTDRARQIIGEAAQNSRRVSTTRIEVAGHADRSGALQYNQRLSQRRADTVAAELVRHGVNRNEIVVQAFGESRPLVPTADGVREPQNRRVEIVLR